MTAKETAALEKLDKKVDGLTNAVNKYHLSVEKHITRCEACRSDVEEIKADLYGVPGSKDKSPGLLSDVTALKRSRRMMVWGLRSLWVLVSGVVVASSGALMRKWWN